MFKEDVPNSSVSCAAHDSLEGNDQATNAKRAFVVVGFLGLDSVVVVERCTTLSARCRQHEGDESAAAL